MLNFEALSTYLSSDEAHDESLGISDLDGFLAGIVCSPEAIPETEWLHFALGEAEAAPKEMRNAVIELYEDTKMRLEDGFHLEPVFWERPDGTTIAMDWCEGYMDAVKLRPERWDAFAQTNTGAKLMLPILVHMIDDEGNSVMGVPQEELDETLAAAADAIPTVVPAIYRHISMITRN